MNGKFYISQPCGTQSPPDFVVIKDNRIIYIECKSCSGGKPTWNTSLPKLYLLCSKKDKTSTVFYGKDVITPEIYAIYEKYILQMRELGKLLNKELQQHPDNKHGWSYYPRNMYTQTGNNTNWEKV